MPSGASGDETAGVGTPPYSVRPIGVARTPWSKGHCPKSIAAARLTGEAATLIVDAAWRDGLLGLERASHVLVLGWLAGAERDVLVQQPKHVSVPQGCFALRTPARPNPIGVSVVRVVSVDLAAGRISVDALDWFDGTPLIDIKPYYPSNDAIVDAVVSEPR